MRAEIRMMIEGILIVRRIPEVEEEKMDGKKVIY